MKWRATRNRGYAGFRGSSRGAAATRGAGAGRGFASKKMVRVGDTLYAKTGTGLWLSFICMRPCRWFCVLNCQHARRRRLQRTKLKGVMCHQDAVCRGRYANRAPCLGAVSLNVGGMCHLGPLAHKHGACINRTLGPVSEIGWHKAQESHGVNRNRCAPPISQIHWGIVSTQFRMINARGGFF